MGSTLKRGLHTLSNVQLKMMNVIGIIGRELAVKMDPVDRPLPAFLVSVGVGRTGRQHEVGILFDGVYFFADAAPAFAVSAVNEHLLDERFFLTTQSGSTRPRVRSPCRLKRLTGNRCASCTRTI